MYSRGIVKGRFAGKKSFDQVRVNTEGRMEFADFQKCRKPVGMSELSEASDEELIRMVRMDNMQAEDILLSKYKRVVKIRAAAYYMAGADHDDVIQEGMIGLFKAVRDFDEKRGTSFGTFANLCIQRQIISAIKAAARLKHSPLNNSLSLSDPASSGEERGTLGETIVDDKNMDPEYLIVARERLQCIQSGLCGLLTEMERGILSMYIQGRSYKEIAERLDKTDKSVDNAIRRAKKKLTDLLED